MPVRWLAVVVGVQRQSHQRPGLCLRPAFYSYPLYRCTQNHLEPRPKNLRCSSPTTAESLRLASPISQSGMVSAAGTTTLPTLTRSLKVVDLYYTTLTWSRPMAIYLAQFFLLARCRGRILVCCFSSLVSGFAGVVGILAARLYRQLESADSRRSPQRCQSSAVP